MGRDLLAPHGTAILLLLQSSGLPPLLAAAGEPSTVMMVLGIVAIPLLVALNGFFVAAEFALVAIRRTRVEELVNQGVSGAQAVNDAITNLDRTIAATQLGITLASIALGFVAEPALAKLIQPLFGFLPENAAVVSRHAAAIFIAFSIVTFMHVVFGELMPKAVALQTPDRTALYVAKPLNLFARFSRPVVHVMNGTGNWLLRRLGYTPSGTEGHVHSVDELRMLVEGTEEAGLLSEEAADMVLNVFALRNKTVRDCMVPRERMVALALNAPPEQVLEIARLGAHTRMPVYDGSPDNVVGIVNTKDLFFLFSTSGAVVVEDALYPATFLDPEEPVAHAFKLFRKSHRPMAVVRDEEGKVLGVITMEDVLEEIVGDIEDEHDVPVPKLKLMRRRLPAPPPPRPSNNAAPGREPPPKRPESGERKIGPS
jgi:CBS domain containing-hemolysin-like protein